MNASLFTTIRKTVAVIVLCAFITTSIQSPARAQASTMPWMPKPGVMISLSPPFNAVNLKGMIVHPENSLQFDFIVDRGDEALSEDQKKDEYNKLIKYFLASLATPDDDQWVNLSPYEKDRIIKDDFGKTEMGRDVLAQDYILKQITSSLIYPESKLGQKFWDKVYSQAQQQFGSTNIPVNTFNKVWIVPDEAVVYEKGNIVYLEKSHLKVMLEEDYLSLTKHNGITAIAKNSKDTHALGSKIVREIVLPELEREVNEGKNFALLRQIFSGVILAVWYKKALKESLLGKIYANRSKVKGVDSDPQSNQEIYQNYLKAFKKGVFNYIKEDVDKYTNQPVPRKYFSGGILMLGKSAAAAMKINHDSLGNLSAALPGADIVSAAMRTNREQPTKSSVLGGSLKKIERPLPKPSSLTGTSRPTTTRASAAMGNLIGAVRDIRPEIARKVLGEMIHLLGSNQGLDIREKKYYEDAEFKMITLWVGNQRRINGALQGSQEEKDLFLANERIVRAIADDFNLAFNGDIGYAGRDSDTSRISRMSVTDYYLNPSGVKGVFAALLFNPNKAFVPPSIFSWRGISNKFGWRLNKVKPKIQAALQSVLDSISPKADFTRPETSAAMMVDSLVHNVVAAGLEKFFSRIHAPSFNSSVIISEDGNTTTVKVSRLEKADEMDHIQFLADHLDVFGDVLAERLWARPNLKIKQITQDTLTFTIEFSRVQRLINPLKKVGSWIYGNGRQAASFVYKNGMQISSGAFALIFVGGMIAFFITHDQDYIKSKNKDKLAEAVKRVPEGMPFATYTPTQYEALSTFIKLRGLNEDLFYRVNGLDSKSSIYSDFSGGTPLVLPGVEEVGLTLYVPKNTPLKELNRIFLGNPDDKRGIFQAVETTYLNKYDKKVVVTGLEQFKDFTKVGGNFTFKFYLGKTESEDFYRRMKVDPNPFGVDVSNSMNSAATTPTSSAAMKIPNLSTLQDKDRAKVEEALEDLKTQGASLQMTLLAADLKDLPPEINKAIAIALHARLGDGGAILWVENLPEVTGLDQLKSNVNISASSISRSGFQSVINIFLKDLAKALNPSATAAMSSAATTPTSSAAMKGAVRVEFKSPGVWDIWIEGSHFHAEDIDNLIKELKVRLGESVDITTTSFGWLKFSVKRNDLISGFMDLLHAVAGKTVEQRAIFEVFAGNADDLQRAIKGTLSILSAAMNVRQNWLERAAFIIHLIKNNKARALYGEEKLDTDIEKLDTSEGDAAKNFVRYSQEALESQRKINEDSNYVIKRDHSISEALNNMAVIQKKFTDTIIAQPIIDRGARLPIEVFAKELLEHLNIILSALKNANSKIEIEAALKAIEDLKDLISTPFGGTMEILRYTLLNRIDKRNGQVLESKQKELLLLDKITAASTYLQLKLKSKGNALLKTQAIKDLKPIIDFLKKVQDPKTIIKADGEGRDLPIIVIEAENEESQKPAAAMKGDEKPTVFIAEKVYAQKVVPLLTMIDGVTRLPKEIINEGEKTLIFRNLNERDGAIFERDGTLNENFEIKGQKISFFNGVMTVENSLALGGYEYYVLSPYGSSGRIRVTPIKLGNNADELDARDQEALKATFITNSDTRLPAVIAKIQSWRSAAMVQNKSIENLAASINAAVKAKFLQVFHRRDNGGEINVISSGRDRVSVSITLTDGVEDVAGMRELERQITPLFGSGQARFPANSIFGRIVNGNELSFGVLFYSAAMVTLGSNDSFPQAKFPKALSLALSDGESRELTLHVGNINQKYLLKRNAGVVSVYINEVFQGAISKDIRAVPVEQLFSLSFGLDGNVVIRPIKYEGDVSVTKDTSAAMSVQEKRETLIWLRDRLEESKNLRVKAKRNLAIALRDKINAELDLLPTAAMSSFVTTKKVADAIEAVRKRIDVQEIRLAKGDLIAQQVIDSLTVQLNDLLKLQARVGGSASVESVAAAMNTLTWDNIPLPGEEGFIKPKANNIFPFIPQTITAFRINKVKVLSPYVVSKFLNFDSILMKVSKDEYAFTKSKYSSSAVWKVNQLINYANTGVIDIENALVPVFDQARIELQRIKGENIDEAKLDQLLQMLDKARRTHIIFNLERYSDAISRLNFQGLDVTSIGAALRIVSSAVEFFKQLDNEDPTKTHLRTRFLESLVGLDKAIPEGNGYYKNYREYFMKLRSDLDRDQIPTFESGSDLDITNTDIRNQLKTDKARGFVERALTAVSPRSFTSAAMANPLENASAKNGGIDLNAAMLNMQIKRDGKGVPLPFSQQDLKALDQIEGLIPEIFKIQPATSFPLLSQLAGAAQSVSS